MRRISIEVDYRGFWSRIFGRHAAKVEVLEAIRSLKCDRDGFGLVVRIRLRDPRIRPEDLVSGVLRHVETLHKEADGSYVMFLRGEFPYRRPRSKAHSANLVAASPPEFVGVNRMRATFVGSDKDARVFLERIRARRLPYTILGLTPFESRDDSPLADLTEKQRRALLAAYAFGYYDVPRRVTSEHLARRLGVDKSTLVEHLRKAERRLLSRIASGAV